MIENGYSLSGEKDTKRNAAGNSQNPHINESFRQATGKAYGILRLIMDSVNDAIIFLKDKEIVECNKTALRIFGIENKEEFIGHSIIEFLPPQQPDGRSSADVVEEIVRAVRNENLTNICLEYIRKSGVPFEAEGSLGKFELGGKLYLKTILRDVTERMNLDKRLTRINRALRTLSEGNQMLVRVKDEQSLLIGICEVIVEHGGYSFAWVGFVNEEEGNTVTPVAFAGKEDGYLKSVHITYADEERGRGPTGRAIRTGKPQFTKDIRKDPDFAPWREEAVKRGFLSSVALPLIIEEKVIGTLNIYADEPDAFDPEEIKLFTEMANDLAYGIHTLRNRILQKRAEEALRASEKKYKLLVETARDAIILCDMEGRIQFINSGWLGITAFRREEAEGKNILDLFEFDEKVLMLSLREMREAGKEDVFYMRHISLTGDAGGFRWKLPLHRLLRMGRLQANSWLPET